MLEIDLPAPNGLGEVMWLEPYPDVLLERLADTSPGPDARYEAKEAISLAFVTALQLLPPRQRAALILRDVIGFHAKEVAHVLDSTEESVTSALKRARASMHRRLQLPSGQQAPPPPRSPEESVLVERFTRAFEASDVDGLVALLSDDVRFSMPPIPLEWRGRERAGQFMAAVWQGVGPHLVATRANGQPAFGLYMRDPSTEILHAIGLLVLTLAGSRICAITRFDTSVLQYFGLLRMMPAVV
jgi:RNA polymerase sigma-70 factor (ECF subfamily)